MQRGSDILKLVYDAQALNAKIFSLPRILILASLEDLGDDGSSYRELKAGLSLDDGVLFSNLKVLEGMGYVRSREVVLESKKLSSYFITREGREAIRALRSWFKKWFEGCQKNG